MNGQTLYSYAAGDKNVTLRNGTRTVGDYAFYGCEAESIVIPETVTAISSDAFDNLASTGGIPIILPTDTISLGYAPNGFSSNDLEPYKLVFIFRRGDELVCETTDTRRISGRLSLKHGIKSDAGRRKKYTAAKAQQLTVFEM